MSIFRGNVNPLNIVTALTPTGTIGTSAAGIAPTGTINTGASGNITLGSALHRAFTEGIWLYLPTIATTPAITAGVYWVVMSSTTVGTVYASGAGSSAIDFTVGSAYTGATATAVALGTVTIPANTLTSGVVIQSIPQFVFKNSAGIKTMSANFGSTQYWLNAPTTNASAQTLVMLRGLTTAKQEGTAASSNGTGSTPSLPPILAEDAATEKTITFYGSLATATDWIVLDGIHHMMINPQ